MLLLSLNSPINLALIERKKMLDHPDPRYVLQIFGKISLRANTTGWRSEFPEDSRRIHVMNPFRPRCIKLVSKFWLFRGGIFLGF